MKRNKFNVSTYINFLVGFISMGLIIWQRSKTQTTTSANMQPLHTGMLPEATLLPTSYALQFPQSTPLLVGTMVAYQTGNLGLGLFSNLVWWGATRVSAQGQSMMNLGLALQGGVKDYNAGSYIASAGDVNGDGKPDFLIGAGNGKANGRATGISYLIYGAANLPTIINLNNLGTLGVQLQSSSAVCSVASAGDVNSDGKSDFLIGTYSGYSTEPTAYLIYGAANLPGVINLNRLGVLGVTIGGVVLGFSGGMLSGNWLKHAGFKHLKNDPLQKLSSRN